MKKVLRSLMLLAFFSFSIRQINAQCTVSNVIIQNIRNVAPGPGTCTVTFDVSFNIENNNGNKYIFIHAWLQSQYPNYFQCVDGHTTLNGAIHAPDAADLGASFLNLGINNNTPTPTIMSIYPPDNSVPMTSVTSITRNILPDGSADIILVGVTTTVPVSCGTPVVLVADLWSSQAANAQVAHCVNCGFLYSAGYLSAVGFVNCSNHTYGATVTNNTAASASGFYRVYADINGDGYFTPATDTLLSGPINFNIVAGPGTTTTISGPVPTANVNQGVFIVLTQTSGSASGASRVFFLPSTQCSTLPVTLSSFTAKRVSNSNVILKWETATEINNRGFGLQRNMGDDNWQTIVFINSQAVDGNSNSILTYSYSDLNASRNITQYRVQQVDLDGKARFSEIRTVRGEGQPGKTIVYPNPSQDGSVKIVFEDRNGARNVMLADISGHIIRQWTITTGNTIQVDNLRPGIYSLRTIVVETREQTVEKIVVTGTK
ncbi:MAG TPA: T9SS type A sorting domain-containing protein [Chitinophagaceae bacterium]|nr:T9SS type A sorting domain-containing protein [Chitinophagaceae bacterium]